MSLPDNRAHHGEPLVKHTDLLQQLRDQRCAEAVAQPETGGDLLLGFGRPIPYRAPNPKLLATQGSEWTLMVHSPWRIDGPDGVEADWNTVADKSSRSSQGHLTLVGRVVQSIEILGTSLDLIIRFQGGYELKVFCDTACPECWFLSLPDRSSLVARRDRVLSLEQPDEAN